MMITGGSSNQRISLSTVIESSSFELRNEDVDVCRCEMRAVYQYEYKYKYKYVYVYSCQY